MPTVLITGASQGLGLEFAKQYSAEGWKVLATVRDTRAAETLSAMNDSIKPYKLDVNNIGDIQGLARSLESHPIDVVISNAGIMGGDVDLSQASADQWMDVLRTNTIAPVMLALAFASNLERGEKKKLIAITSLMGSTADNTSGGHIPYRTSKAALNMAWKSLALAYAPKGIVSAMVHPGWVRTRMGGTSAPLEAPESVTKMRQTIEALTPDKNGAFLRYDGSVLPW